MWGTFLEVAKPYLNSILIGFGGLLIAYLAAQVVSRLLVKPLGRGWSRFLGSLAALAVIIWTLKLILESAGFVVVLVTAVTGAFALGSERTASDLVAGASLFFSQIFKTDDFVQIAGFEGGMANTWTDKSIVFGASMAITSSLTRAGSRAPQAARAIKSLRCCASAMDPGRMSRECCIV